MSSAVNITLTLEQLLSLSHISRRKLNNLGEKYVKFNNRGIALSLSVVVASAGLFGCAAVGNTGCNGIIYNNTVVPNYADPTAGDASLGPREGIARTHDVLGLVSWGDAGTEQAAVNGGVTNIKTIDVGTYNILGVYTERYTKVNGDGHMAAPNGVNYYPKEGGTIQQQ